MMETKEQMDAEGICKGRDRAVGGSFLACTFAVFKPGYLRGPADARETGKDRFRPPFQ